MLIAAAAAMFAACQQEDVVIDQSSNNNVQQAIGFSTYTPSMTRAENSDATKTSDLENYQYQFTVYGFKYVGTTSPVETKVFNGQLVQWSAGQAAPFLSTGDWFYAPVRYWDKAAKSYSFYACTPSTAPVTGDPLFTFNSEKYTFSLKGYKIDGKSLAQNDEVTGQPDDIFAPNNDVTKNRDYMIATDVTGYSTYTKDRVQFNFNHILSRFNMAVKTTIPASTATVTLKELSINNMPGKGDFDENKSAASTTGSAARWSVNDYTAAADFVKFGYLGTNDIYLTPEDPTATIDNEYNYVYQGLVIPQTVAYQGDLELNGSNAVAAGATGASAPYLYIEYEIAYNTTPVEKETNKAYYNLASLFQNGYVVDANGNKAVMATGPSSTDGKVYTDGTNFFAENGTTALTVIYMGQNNNYYSDKDLSTPATTEECNNAQAVIILDATKNVQYVKRGDAAVTFCEGWQNNLMITIDPIAILFDASVYEWSTKENVDVTIQ